MEEEQQYRQKSRKRRIRCIILAVVVLLLLIVVLAIALGLTLGKTTEQEAFKRIFTTRCEAFKENDCEKIWSAFEEAYVDKDPCAVPPQAYDALVKAAPFKCNKNRMMFWSKTKDVVHDFTEKRDCYVTLEDTLLGSVLDGLTWCGKEGSKDTFTSGCPGWSECDNNSVRSFWNQASASFAQVACGNVSAMLNGSLVSPFSPNSVFASVEVKQFNPATMKSLEVILVTQEKKVSNCTNSSLKDLQKELAAGIVYSCQEVPQSQLEECASQPEKPCGSCW